MTWNVYLSGEIHTDWRGEIEAGANEAGLPVAFTRHDSREAASPLKFSSPSKY